MSATRQHNPARPARARGFTLIELLIVIAVLGLLVSVAVPSYMTHVNRTHRAEGQQVLLNTAQRLERCFSSYGSYNDSNCPVSLPVTSDNGHYEITSSDSSVNASDFTLVAAPQGGQSEDKCGKLTLSDDGAKGVSGADSGVTAADCW